MISNRGTPLLNQLETTRMLRAEYKDVTLGGLRVRYVQAGRGPVVLLLHGLGASLVTWCRNVEPLARAGFTVLALDLPGHGGSDKPRRLSYDPVSGARLVEDFAGALGVERLSIVGSSAGGLIAGLFALDHPQRVERLVLVSSGGLGRSVSWFLRVASLPVVGELIYQYQPWLHHRIGVNKRMFFRPPPFVDQVLEELHRISKLPGSRRATLRAIRSSINYSGQKSRRQILDRLKGSPVPLMIVWGREDIIIPASQAGLVRRELPRSVVRVIPECGHWPHMEKADEFNDLLIRFLRGTLADGAGSAGR